MQKIKNKLIATAAMCILAAVPAANASFTTEWAVGGVANGDSIKVNFDGLLPGSTGGTVNTPSGPLKVSFDSDGAVVVDSATGVKAAPFLSGGNGVGFGDGGGIQADGVNQTQYLTSGKGSVTLEFAQDQNYLGLLWGSVDTYNTLTFFSNGAQIGGVTGSQVITMANGNQLELGTVYANFTFTGQTFDKVVASSSDYAFEFDNVAFSAVPEPTTIIAGALLLLPFGVSTLRMLRKNKVA